MALCMPSHVASSVPYPSHCYSFRSEMRPTLHSRRKQGLLGLRCSAAVLETEAAGNWVLAPTLKARGIVHFLGGAFAGASPQLTYSALLKRIAAAGYTVVATPYAVTFRHLDCAQQVHQAFIDGVSHLHATGQEWMVPDVPVHGLGHSNGALLHLLIGACCQPHSRASNVLISFNNKQVKEAIPIPLTSLQSVVQAVRSSPWRSALPTTEALLERAVAFSAAANGVLDQRTATALQPALDQIGAVFDEVADGYLDFVPAPAESQRIIAASYSVPHTLLLRYANDAIDESPQMNLTLSRAGRSGAVHLTTLPGSHVTPCGGDVTRAERQTDTPLNALADSVQAVIQADLRRTARKVVLWLDSHE